MMEEMMVSSMETERATKMETLRVKRMDGRTELNSATLTVNSMENWMVHLMVNMMPI